MEQDEIDALLQGVTSETDTGKGAKKDEELTWDDVEQEMTMSKGPVPKAEVSEVSFQEIKKTDAPKGNMELDFILDIPLNLTVELGRCRMLISELLQLGQGSVVELAKLAGEPMDVFVNNRLIARGEVVVVNEKFGVRLTDIISPAERVNKLR
ncbi:MAG TPA: flagellar motor switch protein FliN [Syntrophales bacterium]|jgi:flagellar motor switch protein FliN/FliY|nr:flagellar motor switch protein FliN [Syntrophales bacterium]HON24202.1 flagellar motor switch protein FliN [Syntrophales bacterium]HOU77079.1 flagellar motor switch protein FliN [Syntrophales bacterium]HPC33121.1 flagellar motor switch protein FliN [Syntrophales bacterium]HQG35337.1 flagellar motor switch protein FliN [Syntrophales bacterium]